MRDAPPRSHSMERRFSTPREAPFRHPFPSPVEGLYLPSCLPPASAGLSLLCVLSLSPDFTTYYNLSPILMAFGKPKKEKILKTVSVASADKSEKQKSIEQALKEIRTKFGDEAITTFGAGAPRGRIIEIFGPESSGKTTLALHIVAEAQKAGGIAAFVDAEHALDPEYA